MCDDLSGMELGDRFAERSVLDGVLQDVRAGQSRVLVLHGDPGVGKSALMEYVATTQPRQAEAGPFRAADAKAAAPTSSSFRITDATKYLRASSRSEELSASSRTR